MQKPRAYIKWTYEDLVDPVYVNYLRRRGYKITTEHIEQFRRNGGKIWVNNQLISLIRLKFNHFQDD